jgi:Tol biopolymer transport system component
VPGSFRVGRRKPLLRVINRGGREKQWRRGERFDDTDALFTCAVGGCGVGGLCGCAASALGEGGGHLSWQERQVAYTGKGGIYTINPNGSGKTKVTRGSQPSYSPDGKKLVYADWDGNYHDIELYTINAGGGGRTQITHNASDDYGPSWSPDGKKIAYVGRDRNWVTQIYTIDAGGGGKFQVTHRHYRWDLGCPSYSPSGKRIVYTGYDGNDSEVYTIDAGGGNKFQVTHNESFDIASDYSPDGKKIAYSNANGPDWAIYTKNTNGSGKTKVTRGSAPSYSPDGEKMAFVGSRREKLYIIELGGGGKTKVADNVDTVRPSWGIRP